MKFSSPNVVRNLAFCSAAALVGLIACSDDPGTSPATGGSAGKAGASTAGSNNTAGMDGKSGDGNGGTSGGTGGKSTAGTAGTNATGGGGTAGGGTAGGGTAGGGAAGAAGAGGAGESGAGGGAGDGSNAGAGGSAGDNTGNGGEPGASGASGAGGAGEPTGTIVNLAIGKTVTASAEENGNFAPRGIDGDDGTRWCAANGDDGQWLRVDLGAAHDLTGTEVFWESNAASYKYKVEVSTDDQTWTQVVDQSGNTTVAQTTTDAFTANARYVRITTLNIDPDWMWASFWELRVMGY